VELWILQTAIRPTSATHTDLKVCYGRIQLRFSSTAAWQTRTVPTLDDVDGNLGVLGTHASFRRQTVKKVLQRHNNLFNTTIGLIC
jgi:hypothetical protein